MIAGTASISGLFTGDPSSVTVGAEDFVRGMDLAFLVSAFIALAGGVTSLTRGRTLPEHLPGISGKGMAKK
jgi:hypothetical protein